MLLDPELHTVGPPGCVYSTRSPSLVNTRRGFRSDPLTPFDQRGREFGPITTSAPLRNSSAKKCPSDETNRVNGRSTWRGCSYPTPSGGLAPAAVHNGTETTNTARTTNAATRARNPLGLIAKIHKPGNGGRRPSAR